MSNFDRFSTNPFQRIKIPYDPYQTLPTHQLEYPPESGAMKVQIATLYASLMHLLLLNKEMRFAGTIVRYQEGALSPNHGMP